MDHDANGRFAPKRVTAKPHPHESALRRDTDVEVFLTISSVCAMLDLSRWTIKRLEAEGKFPRHVKLHQRNRHYREADIIAWVRERELEQEVEERIAAREATAA